MFEKLYQKISSGLIKPLSNKQFNKLSRHFDALNQNKLYDVAYQNIAFDLKSPQNQVFEAAVYTLCVIAVQKPIFKKNITDILTKTLQENIHDETRFDYMKRIISYHGLDDLIHNQ